MIPSHRLKGAVHNCLTKIGKTAKAMGMQLDCDLDEVCSQICDEIDDGKFSEQGLKYPIMSVESADDFKLKLLDILEEFVGLALGVSKHLPVDVRALTHRIANSIKTKEVSEMVDAFGLPVLESNPRRARDAKAAKKGQPVFVFGDINHHSDWQHSFGPAELDTMAGDYKYRSGFSYGNLPGRIKLFRERYGDPEIVHVVASPASTIHAIFFERGKEMIRIWDRGNVLSEFQWKAFERQAHQAGYAIKRFGKGLIEPSHGYWLDERGAANDS